MKFLDQAKVFVRSGDGGLGCVSLYRRRSMAFGIPDGGDGGPGGNVLIEVVPSLNTLIDFRFQQHFKAGRGKHGMGKNRTGAKGQDILLRVPQGTQIFDAEQDLCLADLTRVGQRLLLLRGGRGGVGNVHDNRTTPQDPTHHRYGQSGTEQWVHLRLKLLADVGLVGLPNAGKSTFLTSCTKATPKIADYPFTTITPHLGVVVLDRDTSFVVADIPGLIAGAHKGHGLGDRFLGHLERTRVLVHLIDSTHDDVYKEYMTVRDELSAYGHGLADKSQIVALTKCDAIDQQTQDHARALLQKMSGIQPHLLSAVTGVGMTSLLRRVQHHLTLARKEESLEDTALVTNV